MNRILYVFSAGVALAMGSAALAQAPSQPPDADLVAGQVLYSENCASCHGAELAGQTDWQIVGDDGLLPAPPHDHTGHTWHHGDALLFDYTRLGGAAAMEQAGIIGFNSGMPGFSEALSDAEIWNILAYIKSTWPDRVRDIQQTRTEAERLWGN